MTEFGTRLKNLRIGLNLTQDEAAAAINVSKQAISKWENGHGLPDVSSLSALAGLYGTTVDYLLTGEEKVRVEKEVEIVEVEKEKVVEVEKQLTKDMLTAILVQYKRWYFTAYGWVVFSPLFFAVGIVMFVLALPNFSNELIAPLIVGIMFILLGIGHICIGVFYGRKKIKIIKEEIHQKTCKEISFWGFKD